MVGGGGTAENAKRPMALGEGGDKCRQAATSVKSCEAEHCAIQSVLGEKLETSVKSCGRSTQSIVGDSCGGQVGDKCKVMLSKALESVLGDKWETSLKFEVSIACMWTKMSKHTTHWQHKDIQRHTKTYGKKIRWWQADFPKRTPCEFCLAMPCVNPMKLFVSFLFQLFITSHF